MKSYDLLTFDAAFGKPNAETSCRELHDDDLEFVLTIERASFDFPWSREDFEFCLKLERCGVLVAERNGAIVGYLVYETRRQSIRLLSCAVVESKRRSGVGSLLLHELAERLGASRDEVVCFVRERNVVAQLFLHRLGFRAQWLKPSFYSDADEDAYQMTWRLDDDWLLDVKRTRKAG